MALNPDYSPSFNLRFSDHLRPPNPLNAPVCPHHRILQDLGCAPDVMTLTPKYGPCEPESLKGRMMRAVASLGADEVRVWVQAG